MISQEDHINLEERKSNTTGGNPLKELQLHRLDTTELVHFFLIVFFLFVFFFTSILCYSTRTVDLSSPEQTVRKFFHFQFSPK
ncbi:hypothetical protein NC651_021645 [Populus alba x Populus x berolinensis]|nr:hypothetical protein NC651_021645 [Populus alba x Populus x berolinensis]